MIQRSIGILWKSVLILFVFVVMGFLMLEIAFFVPTGRIKAHVSEAVSLFQQEGNYFSVTPNLVHGQLDNFTEAEYLNAATINYKDAGVFTALQGYTHITDGIGGGPAEQLIAYFDDGDKSRLASYGNHFWNGYEIAVKALLVFTTYAGIRYVNVFAESLLLFILFRLMRRRNIEAYQIPFLLMILFLNPFALSLCMTFAGYYYCMVIPCILMCLFHEKLNVGNRYLFFFEAVGIAVIYFNMNYFQLVSFGIPFLFYFLLDGFPKKIRGLIEKFGLYFGGWLFGYAGMMVAKWCILDLFTDVEVWRAMIDRILFRLSSNVGGNEISRLQAVFENLSYAKGNWIFNGIEILFVLTCLVLMIRKGKKVRISDYRIEMFTVFLLLLLVLLRYAVFANHVVIHKWVMYRILAIPLTAFNVLLVKIIVDGNERKMES